MHTSLMTPFFKWHQGRWPWDLEAKNDFVVAEGIVFHKHTLIFNAISIDLYAVKCFIYIYFV